MTKDTFKKLSKIEKRWVSWMPKDRAAVAATRTFGVSLVSSKQGQHPVFEPVTFKQEALTEQEAREKVLESLKYMYSESWPTWSVKGVKDLGLVYPPAVQALPSIFDDNGRRCF